MFELRSVDWNVWEEAKEVDECVVRRLVNLPKSECRYGRFRLHQEHGLLWTESGMNNNMQVFKRDSSSWSGRSPVFLPEGWEKVEPETPTNNSVGRHVVGDQRTGFGSTGDEAWCE